MTVNPETTAVLPAGTVDYALEDSVIELDELIAALEDMKAEGVTHVVQATGNYRGAQWVRLSADWGWASDE